jgi:hypothetical protein
MLYVPTVLRRPIQNPDALGDSLIDTETSDSGKKQDTQVCKKTKNPTPNTQTKQLYISKCKRQQHYTIQTISPILRSNRNRQARATGWDETVSQGL